MESYCVYKSPWWTRPIFSVLKVLCHIVFCQDNFEKTLKTTLSISYSFRFCVLMRSLYVWTCFSASIWVFMLFYLFYIAISALLSSQSSHRSSPRFPLPLLLPATTPHTALTPLFTSSATEARQGQLGVSVTEFIGRQQFQNSWDPSNVWLWIPIGCCWAESLREHWC